MPAEGVLLSRLAAELGVDSGESEIAVSDVHHDWRHVVPGGLFVAVRGSAFDGHDHAAEAVARGAVAVVAERSLGLRVPELIVGSTWKALARAAALVHRFPSLHVDVIGVTGTNGKTTVTHMIEGIGRSAGTSTGLVGTLGARLGGIEWPLDLTTPESSDLQRLLRRMADAGAGLVAIEVSSHALVLHRVDMVEFRVVAFTGLSQDHLDFHDDMESYYEAKASLFTSDRADVAVIFADDPWGHRLAASTDLSVVRAGIAADADVSGTLITADGQGSTFTLRAGGSNQARIRIPVPGRFNVENALVAAASSLEAGIGFEEVCAGLERLPQVPGRFELVPGPWPFQVIVDYAHTPDAVARVIAEARSLARGRVIAVIGAGGDRDVEKRPLMGAAAGTAHFAVITSDNPRSEDPAAIASAVALGLPGSARAVIELDRRLAIGLALDECGRGDVLLILGKGHEQGQEFAGGRIEPFSDDRVVVDEWLARSTNGAV